MERAVVGDRAFAISAPEADNLRWEAKQFAAGKLWHRWDYPHQVGSSDFDERFPIIARYLADNWPAYRTWGVSAISPWEFGPWWKLRPGVDRKRQDLAVDWARLQRPGFSADFIEGRYERMDLAFARDDWVPTAAAQTLLRYNRPLLAWLAGKPAAFTSKDHVFAAGESFEKQLIVLNNSRESVTCDATWSLALPGAPLAGAKKFTVAAGAQERVPLAFGLPATLAPGEYALDAAVRFGTGEMQRDEFKIHVAAAAPPARANGRIALFDPRGETTALLARLGVRAESIGATADLAPFDVLLVGKAALHPDSPAPDISRVRGGLKVVLFEQTAAVLEQRFGFRVAEYGLRQVFPRVPDHPLLAGVAPDAWRDWRGEATLLPPQLASEMRPRYGSTVLWCDLPVTRIWRCGNRGNVASVLIEKPARGDFLPLVDGGYALHYSPLLEFREGRGVIVFCQLDVTARTEPEPSADRIVRNLLGYVADWKPAPARKIFYAGEPAGKTHLESAGFTVALYSAGAIDANSLLVLGPGATPAGTAATEILQSGGRILAAGLAQTELGALLPPGIESATREHIACSFEPHRAASPLAGVGPSDVHNRDPRKLALVTASATIVGNGVLATAQDGRLVVSALAPWQFASGKSANLKRTFRRTSFTLTRLLANQGAATQTPLLERFASPVSPGRAEKRFLHGLYLDQPEEWDDPYRFFRW